MQPPDSLHANFFFSLKQVEKRLKLETHSPQQQHHHSLPQQNQSQSLREEKSETQSLSTPLYLHHPTPTPTPTPILNHQESEIPQEFLSNSFHFSPTQENQSPLDQEKVEASDVNDDDDDDGNDIQVLMQLLGLKDDDEKELKRVGFGCDEGFYRKIVGVKGPKSDVQVERLNKWIKHFLNRGGNDGVKQPLRLAHLLLTKAAFVDDFDAFEFPSTIDEYLQHDPPVLD